ncbi:MAG: T9SS type A sorting domain-containing protein [Sphingobacteriales bacterium]|nr:MAG: T9SS type A sorting domain-containing protein [Sphingobacteriales bacterium]
MDIFPLRDIWSLEYINGKLFAGLEEGGLWYHGNLPVMGVQGTPALTGESIRVYPNPANDILHIDTDTAVDIYLYDMAGKIVRDARAQRSISLEGLPSSNYITVIRNMHGTVLSSSIISKR